MGILFGKTYTLKEKAVGSYLRGKWIPGAVTEKEIKADIQTMRPDEVQSLNLGRHNSELIKVFSNDELSISDQETKKNGDIIIFRNKDYELIKAEPHQNSLINHFLYIGELRQFDEATDI